MPRVPDHRKPPPAPRRDGHHLRRERRATRARQHGCVPAPHGARARVAILGAAVPSAAARGTRRLHGNGGRHTPLRWVADGGRPLRLGPGHGCCGVRTGSRHADGREPMDLLCRFAGRPRRRCWCGRKRKVFTSHAHPAPSPAQAVESHRSGHRARADADDKMVIRRRRGKEHLGLEVQRVQVLEQTGGALPPGPAVQIWSKSTRRSTLRSSNQGW
ncbi:hypothetical protein EDB85DRAFT_1364995 [Lactarius pseudohatsudake]|nr:hypothetical protein EDB85DRAFT_1364995 [Lactarius pseudohatsudake]